MKSAGGKIDDIRDDLCEVLAGNERGQGTRNLARLCRALATVVINRKIADGALNCRHIGLTPQDIAIDCIAELFQRDASGTYVQLKTYFGGLGIENLSGEEILTHLRRLVFSKVNDGLFRIYNEVDPSLGKIIRNIKFVIGTVHNFEELERIGERCICPSFVDRMEQFPTIDRTALEIEMRKTAKGTERIPELMAQLSLFLRRQKEYCRIVPLVDVALAFRSVYAEPVEAAADGSRAENMLLLNDAENLIREACFEVKAVMKTRYDHRGKVAPEHLEWYFQIIEQTLVEKLTSNDGSSKSLFASLNSRIPELTRKDYNTVHKKILEYLFKLSVDRAKQKLAELNR